MFRLISFPGEIAIVEDMKKEEKSTKVSGKEIRSGLLVETIYDSSTNRGLLAVLDSAELSETESYSRASGDKFVPLVPARSLLEHRFVLLPSGIGEPVATEALVNAVQGFIHQFMELSEEFECVCAHYVLLSWVHDLFREIPYLRIRGDFGLEKPGFFKLSVHSATAPFLPVDQVPFRPYSIF